MVARSVETALHKLHELKFDPNKVDIYMQGVNVCTGGIAAEFSEADLKTKLDDRDILIRFDPAINGQLTVQVHAPGVPIRLSLIDERGEVLVQSDGSSATDPDARIVQHVVPGTLFLKVEARNGQAEAYSLTTSFVAANPPNEDVEFGAFLLRHW